MIRKLLPLAVVCLVLAAVAGVVVWRTAGVGARTSQPAIGGDFQLVDQNGRPVDQTLLKGKWTAVFFGYTYCPDVCPTTLQTLGAAESGLGAAKSKFQIVFITVDPRRDTPAQLKDYLSSSAFAPGVVGLTGAPAQIARVAREYGVYYQRQGSGETYGVDHSSAIYLMNPDGRFDSVIPYGLTPQQAREDLLKAMRS
jgi:protein SCO1/2